MFFLSISIRLSSGDGRKSLDEAAEQPEVAVDDGAVTANDLDVTVDNGTEDQGAKEEEEDVSEPKTYSEEIDSIPEPGSAELSETNDSLPYPEEPLEPQHPEEEPVHSGPPTVADVAEEISQDTIERIEEEVKESEDRIGTESPEIQLEEVTETPEIFEPQYDPVTVTEENLVVDVAGEEQVESQQENHHQQVGPDLSQPGVEGGLLPDWLALYIQDQAFIDGDRLGLVGIIALTLLLLHIINSVMNKSSREHPLIRRLAELDRKLFAATNELLIIKKDQAERVSPTTGDVGENSQAVREMELQLQQTHLELETSKESLRLETERSQQILVDLESSKKDAVVAQDEARQAREMVEEMIANQGSKDGGAADDQLMQVVQQLQTQLESQKVVLGKYEPRLKKKEKENRELISQIKQLRADVANANLEKDRIKKELTDTMISVEESASKLNEVFKNEEEWKSLSDLLQSQLDEKSVAIENMETEMSSLKSRISVFKFEAESKEEQLEVLQETLDELQSRKVAGGARENGESDGWDVEEENGWEVEDVNEIKELAKLRVESKRNKETKESLERELGEVQSELESTTSDLERFRAESESLRAARDEVVQDHSDLQRRLEVLTEFFNKKEAELQRQLGLQSAKFGDVSSGAESSARQLVSVTSELDSTKEQVKIIRSELEDQERSLKAAVAAQEKKAHENWVAARQSERKLTELQVKLNINI